MVVGGIGRTDEPRALFQNESDMALQHQLPGQVFAPSDSHLAATRGGRGVYRRLQSLCFKTEGIHDFDTVV